MIKLNGKPINVTIFPDNTSQVWKLEEIQGKDVKVDWFFSHESEFIHLAQLKDLIDFFCVKTHLWIHYLPYGRQDKEISNTSTFALHTFTKLLNSLNFDHITITDAHSGVIFDLIPDCAVYYPPIHKIIKECDINILCYPDKGAKQKYSNIYDEFPYIYGEKVRDQLTGYITSYSLIGECKDKNVLIVDDICDGGATFTILAKELLAKGTKSVVLFTSHGLYSKGLRILFEAGIDRIFDKDGEKTLRTGTIQL